MKNEFNGERLRLARTFRNYTISDFAKKIEVTKQAVLQYEKGDIKPKPQTEFNIITSLNFPKEFFYQNEFENIRIENTFFRALSSTKKIDMQTQETKTLFIVIIYNFLKQYFKLPQLNIPTIDFEDYNEHIEEIAKNARKYWNLGNEPINNMVSLLEKNGIIVSTLNVNNKKIDAFTQAHVINGEEQYCVILSNDKQSSARRNFDAAHELGHILLHNRNIKNIEDLTDEESKELEKEANNFAASFLLPKEAFLKDLKFPKALEHYKELKIKWRVSIASMIMRARQLEQITNEEYMELMKQMSFKRWRTNEPLDNEWKLQEVVLFRKCIDMLKNYDVLSSSEFVRKLSDYGLTMHSMDLEELLDLTSGTLSEKYEDNIFITDKFKKLIM